MGRGRKQRHKGGWSRKLKEVRSEQYREPGYDRYDGLKPYDPQDYKVVINAAKEKGFDGAKILVIGSPGSGKTYSLQTLVNGENK